MSIIGMRPVLNPKTEPKYKVMEGYIGFERIYA